MDKMITELNIMIDGLKRKANALAEILNITENQRTVIESDLPFEEIRDIIFQMNEGKQAAIQIVRTCDDMFEAMLKEIGQDLEARQDMYKPQVRKMQEGIRKVMDVDIKIRVGEEENNRLLDEKRGGTTTQTTSTVTPMATTAASALPTENATVGSTMNQSAGLKPKAAPIQIDPGRVARAYQDGSKNYKG